MVTRLDACSPSKNVVFSWFHVNIWTVKDKIWPNKMSLNCVNAWVFLFSEKTPPKKPAFDHLQTIFWHLVKSRAFDQRCKDVCISNPSVRRDFWRQSVNTLLYFSAESFRQLMCRLRSAVGRIPGGGHSLMWISVCIWVCVCVCAPPLLSLTQRQLMKH